MLRRAIIPAVDVGLAGVRGRPYCARECVNSPTHKGLLLGSAECLCCMLVHYLSIIAVVAGGQIYLYVAGCVDRVRVVVVSEQF